MTQENGLNNNAEAFEDAPNMVPGEIEAAQQIDPANPKGRKSGKFQLIFALAGLLFASGWVYANQDDFKDALGIKSPNLSMSQTGCPSDCSPEDEGLLLCPHAMEAEGCVSSCPHSASEEEICCEEGLKKALTKSLLKGVDDKPAEVEKTAEQEGDSETEKEEEAETTETEKKEVVSAE